MDISFEASFVPRSAIDRACWRSVLLRILARKGKRIRLESDEDILEAVGRVMGLWRRRCRQLKELGWEGAVGKNFQYLRNCPPWMVSVLPSCDRGQPFQCMRSYICPWCWCRRSIIPAYNKLKESLAGCGMGWEKGKRDYPFKLIGHRYSFLKGPGIDAMDAFVLATDFDKRGRKMAAQKTEGVISSVAVYPAKDGLFRLTSAGVVLIPAGQDTTRKMVVTTPSDKNLARLAAYLFPYPSAMLLAPAERALEVLVARKGFRLMSATGVFLGKGKEDIHESSMRD
jgi:hypothetical protein